MRVSGLDSIGDATELENVCVQRAAVTALYDGRQLSKITHANEMLTGETGREHNLRDIGHTGFVENNRIIFFFVQCTVRNCLGYGRSDKPRFCNSLPLL